MDDAKERGAADGRRRPRHARSGTGTPLLRAVRQPALLIDRLVLGLALGPPRARTRLQQPAMRALARRFGARGETSRPASDGPNDGPNNHDDA